MGTGMCLTSLKKNPTSKAQNYFDQSTHVIKNLKLRSKYSFMIITYQGLKLLGVKRLMIMMTILLQ